MNTSYPTERERLIKKCLLVAEKHPDYVDGVPGPSWAQPWHADDPGLRMDQAAKDEAWMEMWMS